MLRESITRVEAMLSDLTSALDQAHEQNARSKQLAEIGSTIDLDEVLARTLEAAGALLGVDGAMVVLDQRRDQGGPSSRPSGSRREEAAGPAGAQRLGQAARGDRLVPLPDRGATSGSRCAAASRYRSAVTASRTASWEPCRSSGASSERQPDEEQVCLLEELALRAGPAIENARRFQEARQLADLDALTGLHNYRYFHETLAREVARAHRYSRNLALVVFDIDDFKAVNDRIGHLAGDSVLAEAAQRVRSVVRGADIACRVGGDEFAVILPESTIADAENLYRRSRAP